MKTETNKELAFELMRSVFDLTGWEGQQKSMHTAFCVRSPEELAEEFRRVAEVLRGLEYTAESSMGVAAHLFLREAAAHAELAQHMCESYVEA